MVAACALLLLAFAGCTRPFYRSQADREVYCLEERGEQQLCEQPQRMTLDPDPRSRMFDPNNPDCPPMPPDDPVSHQLMHCVDGKRGWPCWHRSGDTAYVESPCWRTYLPLNENGEVVLNQEKAVELSLIHSPDFQTQLENIYLSALNVTFQRFRFDAQYFGGNATFFTADGRVRGGGNSLSTLKTDTTLQRKKLMATGGELVVGVANSFVWQFSGSQSSNTNTLLDFALVQPLLRGGGRAVVLEALTDSERALLSNIRQMERYRGGFYAEVVIGRNPGPGPQPGGVGFNGVSGGAIRSTGGFMGLLQTQLLIRNQRSNLVGLRDALRRVEAYADFGLIRNYDVNLTRSSVYQTQSNLLALSAQYETTLDTYKITLGLPPDLNVTIEDPMLERLNLIDPAMIAAREEVATALSELRERTQTAGGKTTPAEFDRLAAIEMDALAQVEVVRQDLEKLNQTVPARHKSLRRLATREEIRRGEVDPSISSIEVFNARVAEIHKDFAVLNEKFKATVAEIGAFRKKPPQQAAPPAAVPEGDKQEPASQETPREQLIDMVDRFASQLLEMSLIQARARLDAATLEPIDLTAERAVEIARENRQDWANARAALVDTWRQIEVVANSLESVLDVTFGGDLNTVGNNPVRFRNSNGRLRVGVEFDAPLTRLAERNAYRTALINYQQARRQYYGVEDSINQDLRDEIRVAHLNELDFEVQRAGVNVAIVRVDQARLQLAAPPRPGSTKGASLNPLATRDLVDALNGLLQAQNTWLRVWINQEAQRLELDLDLGTMKLDERGRWIDPGTIGGDPCAGQVDSEVAPMPKDAPEEIPAPDGKAPDGHAADGQAADGKSADGKTSSPAEAPPAPLPSSKPVGGL